MNTSWAHPCGVLFLAIFLAACDTGKSVSATAAATPPPPEVERVVAVRKKISLQQQTPGRLQAVRTAEVRARVEGIVEQLLFTEGSAVQAGAPLYRLDGRTLESQIRSAQAALDRAHAERQLARHMMERSKSLAATHAVSRQEFDQAEAQYKKAMADIAAAEAALSRAQIDLEHTRIGAPIAGRVGRSRVTEGALVGQREATHLTTIEQIDPIRVNFTQSSQELLRLRRAIRQGDAHPMEQAEVRLLLDDGVEYPVPGTLHFTDTAVDPQSGSVALRAEFPNAEGVLLPGQFVRVKWSMATTEGIAVPQRAVQASPQGQIVLMVDEQNKVVPRPIKTGGFSGRDWIVLEGLQEGEKVILNGVQKARPGAVVTPKDVESSPPATEATRQVSAPPASRTP
ncbi:MAG: efflux RND transporter periplasmic adaptor subunit [Magnetococcus sp. MYC-9]